MPTRPYSLGPDGVRLAVRLTPKAARDDIDGLAETADGRIALAARVRAVPEGGKANRALIALLAKCLSLPKSSMSLASGATSRQKTIVITADGAAEALDALTGEWVNHT